MFHHLRTYYRNIFLKKRRSKFLEDLFKRRLTEEDKESKRTLGKRPLTRIFYFNDYSVKSFSNREHWIAEKSHVEQIHGQP